MIVRVAALLLAATVASAQVAEAPARASPVRQALVESLGPGTLASDKSTPFESLVSAMTPEMRATAKTKLDAIDRAPLSTAALEDLSKAYSLLGSHGSAAEAGLALQSRDPKNTKGLVLASSAKLDEGDYAGSVALAEQALKLDPNDAAARAVWHTAKGRVAPTSRPSNSQPLAQNSVGSVQTTGVATTPLYADVKKRTSGVVPDFQKDQPIEPASSGHPWLPYAIGFGLTAFGIGLAVKHSLEDAKATVEQTVDKAEDGAANLYAKGKDWVQDHPKTTIAAAALASAAVVAIAVASLPAAGGGGLTYAVAGGGTQVAGEISATHLAAAGTAVAAVPIYMKASRNLRPKDVSDKEPISTNGKTEKDITKDQLTRIREVVKRIRGQLKDAFPKDSTPYRNQGPGYLPQRPEGYYQEYTVPQANGARGPERIITGANGEMYFSPDHYYTFIPISL